MELLRSWVITVTVCAMVIACGEALMPSGSVKRVWKFTGGLLLVMTFLQPLVHLDGEMLADMASALPAGSFSREELTEKRVNPMGDIIEDELSAYIAEEGARMGITCTAQVKCIAGENGVPIPEQVAVSGNLTPEQRLELSGWIAEELGLKREAQSFRNEGIP